MKANSRPKAAAASAACDPTTSGQHARGPLSSLTERELEAELDRTRHAALPEVAEWADNLLGVQELVARNGWRAGTPPVEGPAAYPEPEDRGLATLSESGEVEHVEDIGRPGRIVVFAAEESTGKSYANTELAIRVAVAGGSFAGTWQVLERGRCSTCRRCTPTMTTPARRWCSTPSG